MESYLAMSLVTGFVVAAVAVVVPACGSSSGGNTMNAGTGGTKGTGAGGGSGTGAGGTKGAGAGGTSGTGSGGTSGTGTCSNPPDAAGEKLLPTACVACLASACGSDLDTCLCDPNCLDVIKCVDGCVEDGGAPTGCGPACLAKGKGMSAAEGTPLLLCVAGMCSGGDGAPNPCSAGAVDSGAGEGGAGEAGVGEGGGG